MAGDWIKMRANLRTHPKVFRIASALRADRLRVIGGLYSVWVIFDEHSVDGVLAGYAARGLDDDLGWKGFAAAMMDVDWLSDDGEGLSVPRFDEHNGQSAKRRATESERKRSEREADRMRTNCGQDADTKRTREEKRREEKKVQGQEQSADAPQPGKKRATRLPDDWSLPDPWCEWGVTERPDLGVDGIRRASLEFRDHWRGKGETRADWEATWRNWVRRERRMNGHAREPTLAEKRAANYAKLTGGSNGNTIDITPQRVDQASVPALPSDLREPIAHDVGRREHG